MPATIEKRNLGSELRAMFAERRDLVLQLEGFKNRELTDDEKAAFDALVMKIEELDERMGAVEEALSKETEPETPKVEENSGRLDSILQRMTTALEKVEKTPALGRRSAPAPVAGAPGYVRDWNDREFRKNRALAARAFFLQKTPHYKDEHRAACQALGVDWDSAHMNLRMMETAPRTAADVDKWWERAQTVGTPTAGGNLVQTDVVRFLEKALLAFCPIRQFCKVIRTTEGNPLDQPFVNDTNNKGEIVSEASNLNSQDFTVNKVTLNAWLYNSKFINVSMQLLQDSVIDLPSEIGTMAGERIGRIQADHTATGSGTGQPAGLCTASVGSSLGRTAASATAISTADILHLMHSVDRAYRPGAAFMMHDSILLAVRLLVDTLGRPIFQPSYNEGEPDKILGHPVIINNSMDSTIASTKKTMLFGDFGGNYIIRDALDPYFARLNELFMGAAQIGFIAFQRMDARILNNAAIKHLVH